ncbi:hypothetical protein DSECCO2_213430 [anaerobic digester metagenome]
MPECSFFSGRGGKTLTAVLAVLVLAIAVAGCTAERTAYAAGEQSKMVEIRYCDALSAGYGTVGEVTLKNIHDEPLSSVEVLVKFYDGETLAGDGRETVRDLGPGETARLTIPYQGFADRVEVDEIRIIV